MDKFKDWIVNLLFIGLFFFAIISFAVGLGNNYGKTNMVENDNVDITSIQTEIESINEQAEGWEKVFTSDNPFIQFGGLIIFSIWGIATLIWSVGFGLFNLIIQSISNILQIPPIVTSIILTIAIVTLIMLAWRLIKVGE
ncbi:MAG: hypothetical protein WD512_10610 [Candidatus Paceibacterota bacterium]